MPSSVIHIRLDDWALLGCYDILQAGSKEVVNLPSATIVREVVNGLVRKMQSSQHIPTYTKEERLERSREIYGGEFTLDEEIAPENLFNLDDPHKDEDDLSDLSIAEIAKRVQENIHRQGDPKISSEITISEAEAPTGITQTVDLLTVKSELSFDEVKKLAPKDRLIEWAVSTASEVIQKAVAICYSNIARDLWGSDRAEEIINKLCKSHRAEE